MGWVSAIVSLVSAIYGGYSDHRRGAQAKRRSKEKQRMETKVTNEKVKRMEEENRRRASIARARAGASGVGGASTEVYISALEESGREEVDWLKEVGASIYAQHKMEGETAYSEAQQDMWGNVGQGVQAGVSLYDSWSDTSAPAAEGGEAASGAAAAAAAAA